MSSYDQTPHGGSPSLPSGTPERGRNNQPDETLSETQSIPLDCMWKSCTAQFHAGEDLYKHICEEHINKSPRPHTSARTERNFCCRWSNCKVRVKKRDHLVSHVRIHVNIWPYVCDMCAKKFRRPQDLKKHLGTSLHYQISTTGVSRRERQPSARRKLELQKKSLQEEEKERKELYQKDQPPTDIRGDLLRDQNTKDQQSYLRMRESSSSNLSPEQHEHYQEKPSTNPVIPGGSNLRPVPLPAQRPHLDSYFSSSYTESLMSESSEFPPTEYPAEFNQLTCQQPAYSHHYDINAMTSDDVLPNPQLDQVFASQYSFSAGYQEAAGSKPYGDPIPYANNETILGSRGPPLTRDSRFNRSHFGAEVMTELSNGQYTENNANQLHEPSELSARINHQDHVPFAQPSRDSLYPHHLDTEHMQHDTQHQVRQNKVTIGLSDDQAYQSKYSAAASDLISQPQYVLEPDQYAEHLVEDLTLHNREYRHDSEEHNHSQTHARNGFRLNRSYNNQNHQRWFSQRPRPYPQQSSRPVCASPPGHLSDSLRNAPTAYRVSGHNNGPNYPTHRTDVGYSHSRYSPSRYLPGNYSNGGPAIHYSVYSPSGPSNGLISGPQQGSNRNGPSNVISRKTPRGSDHGLPPLDYPQYSYPPLYPASPPFGPPGIEHTLGCPQPGQVSDIPRHLVEYGDHMNWRNPLMRDSNRPNSPPVGPCDSPSGNLEGDGPLQPNAAPAASFNNSANSGFSKQERHYPNSQGLLKGHVSRDQQPQGINYRGQSHQGSKPQETWVSQTINYPHEHDRAPTERKVSPHSMMAGPYGDGALSDYPSVTLGSEISSLYTGNEYYFDGFRDIANDQKTKEFDNKSKLNWRSQKRTGMLPPPAALSLLDVGQGDSANNLESLLKSPFDDILDECELKSADASCVSPNIEIAIKKGTLEDVEEEKVQAVWKKWASHKNDLASAPPEYIFKRRKRVQAEKSLTSTRSLGKETSTNAEQSKAPVRKRV